MSIVGVTASYAVYDGPYTCWAVFTIPVTALKNNNQCSENNTLNSNQLNPKPLQFHLAQGAWLLCIHFYQNEVPNI